MHARVFNSCCDNVMTSGSKNRSVVRLGATTGENNLARGGADETRDGLAGLLDSAARDLTFSMNTRRIAKHVTQRFFECFQNARIDRRGRVVVKIGAHALLVLLIFAVANAPLLAKNPADDGSTTAPPPKPADPAKAAPPDPGVRKLSRRERKERIRNLSEKFRQFLTDVEPIMQDAELDTFLLR